jgi:hypothetical protein
MTVPNASYEQIRKRKEVDDLRRQADLIEQRSRTHGDPAVAEALRGTATYVRNKADRLEEELRP